MKVRDYLSTIGDIYGVNIVQIEFCFTYAYEEKTIIIKYGFSVQSEMCRLTSILKILFENCLIKSNLLNTDIRIYNREYFCNIHTFTSYRFCFLLFMEINFIKIYFYSYSNWNLIFNRF